MLSKIQYKIQNDTKTVQQKVLDVTLSEYVNKLTALNAYGVNSCFHPCYEFNLYQESKIITSRETGTK